MTFDNSVTKHRSVYFHFLDGLLTDEAGGTYDNVISTLKEVAQINLDNIIFAKFTIDQLKYNMIFNERQNVTFDYSNDDLTKIPLDLLKFCIIPMKFNKHQTTTLIFTKNDRLYLYILNTGLDMNENGDKITIHDQDLYQLTKGVCLCDITNESELNEAYKLIKQFLFISFLYKYVNDGMYVKEKNQHYYF